MRNLFVACVVLVAAMLCFGFRHNFHSIPEVSETANLTDFEVLSREEILFGTISVVRRRATDEEFVLYFATGQCSASIAPAKSHQE